MQFKDLTDDQLIEHLKALHATERAGLVRLIACLGEIDSRRAYLKYACSSLFAYCTRALRMSEDEAFRRIGVSHLARRFPDLLGRIERGEIHLTAIMMLREHLTEASYDELIKLGSGKSKDVLKRLVAARFPTRDVRSEIRLLPTSQSLKPIVATSLTPSTATTASPLHAQHAAPIATPTSLSGLGQIESSPLTHSRFVLAAPQVVTSSGRSVAMIEPLSATRHKVQFTASAELREKIERALRLTSHRNPKGDLAEMVESAVDLLIRKLENERLGKSARGTNRTSTARATTENSAQKCEVEKSEPENSKAERTETHKAPTTHETHRTHKTLDATSSRVSRAVRRKVFERDG